MMVRHGRKRLPVSPKVRESTAPPATVTLDAAVDVSASAGVSV